MARKSKTSSDVVVFGSGNVFADLGLADAEERQTKLRLVFAINQILESLQLTQAAAAEMLKVNQPKISALQNYKLEGFSVERLMTFLTALDRDVEIAIKKKPSSRASGKIRVIAA
ncbi:putative XRE-type DNA-binding protein [Rhizomicrobium palustre]|uniref:Putative XRE-type DNA-binding protein n=1 Tax=Rhizomicrobium palustre TaxID=189966 RepID=A0A846N391_9PROT|nr:helix-turn-helix transcriptional regulator [Rhizomicrobium palustre]NIK90196.1 putative XRE-type DNA-binding protein [Rhizomicrobium palustre]